MTIASRNIGRRFLRGLEKHFAVLSIGLVTAALIIWWLLNYREAVSPETLRMGNFVAIPIAEPQTAVTEFPIRPVKEVTSELSPDELVLGVEVAGEARAYPINMLSGPNREILNDTLGGRPIAATW